MQHENVESLEHFLFTLDWLLAVTARYSGHIQFGLAHINYGEPSTLGEAYGAQKASQKLDEVLHSLRKAFRKTDLVARDGVDFWILVPFTPATERLSDKIKYIIETASQGGIDFVERDISIFSLSNDVAELPTDQTAAELLAYLKQNHIQLSHMKVMLPASD